MTISDRLALRQQLVDHEGLRLSAYRCSSGKLTILVGYNVDDRGLVPLAQALGRHVAIEDVYEGRFSHEDAMRVLDADIDRIEREVRQAWPTYDALDGVRQRVVIDFVFNVGGAGARKFRSAIAMLELAVKQTQPELAIACYTAVAFHAMDSIWARQVDDGLAGRKGRADRLARMMCSGVDPGPMA